MQSKNNVLKKWPYRKKIPFRRGSDVYQEFLVIKDFLLLKQEKTIAFWTFRMFELNFYKFINFGYAFKSKFSFFLKIFEKICRKNLENFEN